MREENEAQQQQQGLEGAEHLLRLHSVHQRLHGLHRFQPSQNSERAEYFRRPPCSAASAFLTGHQQRPVKGHDGHVRGEPSFQIVLGDQVWVADGDPQVLVTHEEVVHKVERPIEDRRPLQGSEKAVPGEVESDQRQHHDVECDEEAPEHLPDQVLLRARVHQHVPQTIGDAAKILVGGAASREQPGSACNAALQRLELRASCGLLRLSLKRGVDDGLDAAGS
mmetsp:Transcript_36299/g.103300  ORF Transcript_36299/g.103300 Transcript_36299/m.103300 type:complete len:223 (+) Transcript_36299:244-912(+)